MQNQEFKLTGDYVALCDLLKLAGIVSSGRRGQGARRPGRVSASMVSPSRARQPRSVQARWSTATVCGVTVR
jgi:hypothetical protein